MGMKPKTHIDETGRVCTRCGVYKEWVNFNKATKGTKGFRSSCQICDREVSANWKTESNYYENNREHILEHKRNTHSQIRKKNYDLIAKYGITLEEFDSLLLEQRHMCKICKCHILRLTDSDTRYRAAVVDHCHKTGTVRGLLCHTCNRALGLFNDDYELLRRASEYIKTVGVLGQ